MGALVAFGAAVAAVVWAAQGERGDPARCPAGLEARGPRCCGAGQHLDGARCRGEPTSCAEGMTRDPQGCTASSRRVRIAGGELHLGAFDWDTSENRDDRRITLPSFDVDSHEVTVIRWRRCVAQGACPRVADLEDAEPGQPVRGVPPSAAARLCEHDGGRLPTSDEWTFAAAGNGRRFPWGTTGLVCRRAAFGLARGPCAEGADQPDLAGARPDGATPEGIADLAGGVAEWASTRGSRWVARGGSYRATSAAELKTWAAEDAPADARHVGFRCVYPSET